MPRALSLPPAYPQGYRAPWDRNIEALGRTAGALAAMLDRHDRMERQAASARGGGGGGGFNIGMDLSSLGVPMTMAYSENGTARAPRPRTMNWEDTVWGQREAEREKEKADARDHDLLQQLYTTDPEQWEGVLTDEKYAGSDLAEQVMLARVMDNARPDDPPDPPSDLDVARTNQLKEQTRAQKMANEAAASDLENRNSVTATIGRRIQNVLEPFQNNARLAAEVGAQHLKNEKTLADIHKTRAQTEQIEADTPGPVGRVLNAGGKFLEEARKTGQAGVDARIAKTKQQYSMWQDRYDRADERLSAMQERMGKTWQDREGRWMRTAKDGLKRQATQAEIDSRHAMDKEYQTLLNRRDAAEAEMLRITTGDEPGKGGRGKSTNPTVGGNVPDKVTLRYATFAAIDELGPNATPAQIKAWVRQTLERNGFTVPKDW